MVTQFENLDNLLQRIGLHMRSSEIKRGRVIKQGEYYHKPYLAALGNPLIVKPNSFKGYRPEHDCEMYVINYENNSGFVAILPLRDKFEKRDAREPIFTLRTDLIDYFISAKIGYNGFREMTFPDKLNVIKSLVQFPIVGFEKMSSDEVMQYAKMIDFSLVEENYSSKEDRSDKFTGWKRQFDNDVLVTQIKADNKWHNDDFNPIYFLAIHRPDSY